MSDGNVTINDNVVKNRHVATSAAIARSKLAQRVLAAVAVPLTELRTWDALATNLPGTPAADDLGLVTGTYGTDAPYVSSGDLKATTTTRRAGFFVQLPPDYEAAQTVQLRAVCGMKTTVADTSVTIDMEAWRLDEDGTLGAADLVSTAAQGMNSLTADERDFSVTASTLLPGDVLYVRLSVTVTDSATLTAVTAAIYQLQLLADLR